MKSLKNSIMCGTFALANACSDLQQKNVEQINLGDAIFPYGSMDEAPGVHQNDTGEGYASTSEDLAKEESSRCVYNWSDMGMQMGEDMYCEFANDALSMSNEGIISGQTECTKQDAINSPLVIAEFGKSGEDVYCRTSMSGFNAENAKNILSFSVDAIACVGSNNLQNLDDQDMAIVIIDPECVLVYENLLFAIYDFESNSFKIR